MELSDLSPLARRFVGLYEQQTEHNENKEPLQSKIDKVEAKLSEKEKNDIGDYYGAGMFDY